MGGIETSQRHGRISTWVHGHVLGPSKENAATTTIVARNCCHDHIHHSILTNLKLDHYHHQSPRAATGTTSCKCCRLIPFSCRWWWDVLFFAHARRIVRQNSAMSSKRCEQTRKQRASTEVAQAKALQSSVRQHGLHLSKSKYVVRLAIVYQRDKNLSLQIKKEKKAGVVSEFHWHLQITPLFFYQIVEIILLLNKWRSGEEYY